MTTGRATFSVNGLGSRRAWCTELEYGFNVAAGASTSRNTTTLVPKQVTSSSWGMTISFATVAQWRAFASWLDSYLDLARSGRVKAMLVEVPADRFSRLGILTRGGYSYGEVNFQTKTDERLTFEGVGSESTRYSKEPTLSTDNRVFYPTGINLDGAGDVERSLYDPSAQSLASFLGSQGMRG